MPKKKRNMKEQKHEEFVLNVLVDRTKLLMQDKTEVYSFITSDNTLFNVHLTYVYRCKKRHTVNFPPIVTAIYYVPNAFCDLVEMTSADAECSQWVANEFMFEMFGIDNCYGLEFFQCGDNEEEEIDPVYGNCSCDDPNPVDHENGHYL